LNVLLDHADDKIVFRRLAGEAIKAAEECAGDAL
jgi:hypothetical protein